MTNWSRRSLSLMLHAKRREIMQLAYQACSWSPDPSTQNAAVLCTQDGEVIYETFAVNDLPNGVLPTGPRWNRPNKYYYVEHAERNAIYNAARHGVSTRGLVMVCPWAACADCARAIIQAGISQLVRHEGENASHWQESITVADEMLLEAGVGIVNLQGEIGAEVELLRNGKKIWV